MLRARATALVIVLACMIWPTRNARTDDGSVQTVGGAVRLMQEEGDIRMVSERVVARVASDMIEVDCTFVMKNEGPADTVLMGFPDGSLNRYSHDHAMQSFRSWVDGVEVKCRRVADANAMPDDPDAPSWWIKPVPFPRGATRSIRDRYRVAPSFHPLSGTSEFRYELWTGASWKGPIGSADIVATIDDPPLRWVVETEPESRKAGNTHRWSFHDFEPGSEEGSPAAVVVQWREPAKTGGAE